MLTVERAREVFYYCDETGDLTWKVRVAAKTKIGSVAGWIQKTNSGKCYRAAEIDGKQYLVHRLVWLLRYGEFPQSQIDHIDGNGLNNRIANLRAVTELENAKNARLQCNNTSGATGVVWHKECRKWKAQIRGNGRVLHLGVFARKEDAIAARKQAERQYGYHENHGSRRSL